jgi:glucosamine--fructose-6-phosphate aminotransferase (isomerizing)
MATALDGQLLVRKGIGKLAEVQQAQRLDELPGNIGIGHVRWATHGGVTDINAHPHLDCQRRIAAVHNGIIENYQELRANMDSRHQFISDTDTEIICHLIEEYLQDGTSLEKAVSQACGRLKGSYALLVISVAEPGKVVGIRKDSPLVVGLGEGGNFVASDTLCLLAETDRVIFLEDGEMAMITADSIDIIDSQGVKVGRQPSQVRWQYNAASKDGHEFYMIKEIFEQPQAIEQALVQDKEKVMEIALDILRARQVVFTACGTSRYAALIGRYAFSRLGGKFSDVVMGSEFGYFVDSVDQHTMVIAISQSGETADVIEGVKKAKEKGATILSLVNVMGSTLARLSDEVLYLNCGPEIGVAATKSFVAQLVLLYLLSFAMANRYEEGMQKLLSISRKIEANLQTNGSELAILASTLSDKKDFYYIARGINFAVAGEGALKLKEIAYVHAEGMPAGELKHGTLALIEKDTPVVVICPDDYTYAETLANAAESKARGAYVISVSDQEDTICDKHIKIPAVEEIFYPLVTIVPLQLFAYHSAIARGLDPDKPRNLAKSVTVK